MASESTGGRGRFNVFSEYGVIGKARWCGRAGNLDRY